MKFEWENIFSFYQSQVGGTNTSRAKVFGGWILCTEIYTDVLKIGNERSVTSSSIFVPDPNHKWVISK